MIVLNSVKKPLLPESTKSAAEFFKTGDWRTLKPEFRAKNSACWLACPIHNHQIRECLQLTKEEKFKEAWQKLVETNPLPAVLGRICPHPCEKECLRGEFDDSIEINTVERLLGDMALEYGWQPKVRELIPRLHLRHSIAIIGGGPAGLAAAYQLRRLGYWVEIFEAEKRPGGMLYYGIPAYRLAKDILREEIKNNILSSMGIKISLGVKVNHSSCVDLIKRFDVVLMAVGSQRSRKLYIKGEDQNPQVISGLEFLRKVNLREESAFGEIVAVIGGGNTAIDAARMAKKSGAKQVSIIYRRREKDMPAFKSEIEAAKQEGINIISCVTPVKIEKCEDGFLRIECQKMELKENDETGRPKPIPLKDPSFHIFAHNLIVAVGEEVDSPLMRSTTIDKSVPARIFIAGDARSGGGGTVAAAIGSGNKAALEIAAYLKTGEHKEIPDNNDTREVVKFSDLNPEHLEKRRSMLKSILNQDPLEEKIRKEAERCFSCGVCNGCGNCWMFCPDVCVIQKEDGEFDINYEYCKGCGICANECPRNVIDMVRNGKEDQ